MKDFAKSTKIILKLEGSCLELLDGAAQTVQINPDNETRVDWRVAVVRQGEAVVRIKALTDEESDAMEMRFPVYVHGMDKMTPFCGVIRLEDDHSRFRENRGQTTFF